MIRRAIVSALFGVLACAAAEDASKAPPVPARSVVPPQYRIGSGDILQIIVWKEQEATVPAVVVRADGKVGLPFVKEIDVSGLTPAQAEGAITERLKPFINDPDVTVIVREVHSKRVYMVGAVKHEGIIDLKYPMTILQTISEAGGLTDYAKRKKIYILRNQNGGKAKLYFNYDEVIRGENMAQNIEVMPDDTIVVPH